MGSKITKRRVDAAKPGQTIWDGELKGFGLRVSKGGVKSFCIKYRHGGLQRWLTLGRYGSPWTVETARKKARKLLQQVQDGRDPAAEKADDAMAETLSDFSVWYIEEYSKAHKKASTTREEARALKNHILPALGKKRVRDIQYSDITRFYRGMKKTPSGANRTLAVLRHMLTVAMREGVRPKGINPCSDIKKYPETERERFLSSGEIKRLGQALRKAETIGESAYVIAAIRLLIITGARLSEILTLEWSAVDLQARLLRLSDSKTGKKTIALPAPAAEVLAKLPRIEGNPFVICGAKDGAHLVNLQKPWRRIRKVAALDDVRLHDLRHSFASVGLSGGLSLPIIGALLGHTQAQTTKRYAHLGDDPRQAAADQVAATIAANLKGENAEVIPLKRRGG